MTRQEQINEQARYLADKICNSVLEWGNFRIGFINGAEWADSHPAGWISVDDELPSDDRPVLCCTEHGYIYIDNYVSGTRYVSIWRRTELGPKWWMHMPKSPVISKMETTT